MKVLVVTPYYHPKVGGLENYARQLNVALSSLHGWEIVIVTSADSHRHQKPADVDGQRIHRLGVWFKLSNTPFNPLWPLQIRRIINMEKPDMIIAHAPVPSLADAAALAKGDTPFVTVYHAATLLKQGSSVFNLLARLYGLIANQALKRADRIWAVSEFVREQLPQALRHKAVILPNAVWADEIKDRSQMRSPHFVFIASLDKSHAWKGLSDVLKAVALCRHKQGNNITLSVIGDGSAKSHYIEEAKRLGIAQYVRFTGKLEGDRKISELRKARALIVYPNTSNDAFPTVLLEAWSQHVPVIVADIGPLPFIVNDLADGYLCRPSDPAALADMLTRIAATPEKSLEDVARTAGLRTRDSFTWERQAAKAASFAGELV